MNAMLREVMEENIATRFARVVNAERGKKSPGELKDFAEELLIYGIAWDPLAEDSLRAKFRQMFKTEPVVHTPTRNRLSLHRPHNHDNPKNNHGVRLRH